MCIVNIDMRWLALYHPVCYRVLIPLCISLVYLCISKQDPRGYLRACKHGMEQLHCNFYWGWVIACLVKNVNNKQIMNLDRVATHILDCFYYIPARCILTGQAEFWWVEWVSSCYWCWRKLEGSLSLSASCLSVPLILLLHAEAKCSW